MTDYHQPQLQPNSNHSGIDDSSLTTNNIEGDVVIKLWSPWKKSQQFDGRVAEAKSGECEGPASSIDQFPEDAFTRKN